MKKEWLGDPQRWNHYAYVRNNPFRYVDPNGEDLTIVYSTAGFYAGNLEWFKKNQGAIEAATRAKFEKVGIAVQFKDRASLTKDQLKELSSLPVQDKRAETFVPGFVQLNYLNGASGMVTRDNPNTSAYGFTNSGRSEVYLNNNGDTGCGGACAIANTAAHEIGHALGLESRGHTGFSFAEGWREYVLRRPPDVMSSWPHDPVDMPMYYNTNIDKNVRILEEVKRVSPKY